MEGMLTFILLASRDETFRQRLAPLLRAAGYALLEATTPEELFRQAMAPVRLLLVEGNLVGAVHSLRAEPILATLPVIVLGGDRLPDLPPPVVWRPRPIVPADLLPLVKEQVLVSGVIPPSVLGVFRGLIDGLTAHMAVLDPKGIILAVNETWRDFARNNRPVCHPDAPASIEHLCEGANYLAVCETASGKEHEEARAFALGLREVLTGRRTTFKHEYPCHSSTELRWFIARVSRIALGNANLVLVTHENITDRKRIEGELTRLNRNIADHLDDCADGCAILTPEGEVLYMNRAAERFLGQPREAFANQKFWEVLPHLVAAGVKAEVEQARTHRQPINLERYAPGANCWGEWRISPNADGFVIFFRDITADRCAKEAERQTREKHVERLETSVREYRQLVEKPREREGNPFREAAPQLFRDWVREYEEILEQALEQRAYRVENNLSRRLRELAERMGFIGAGPRDVVDLHTRAIQTKTKAVPTGRAYTYIEEGRLLLVELMGDLVTYYRAGDPETSRNPTEKQPEGDPDAKE